MPDFSKARVGDRVYDIRHGEGVIVIVDDHCAYPIVCRFGESRREASFTLSGLSKSTDATPTLYWSKPEISDPPPPKRKVKRQIWLNVYLHVRGSVYVYNYETKEKADDCATRDRIACIPIEWEKKK